MRAVIFMSLGAALLFAACNATGTKEPRKKSRAAENRRGTMEPSGVSTTAKGASDASCLYELKISKNTSYFRAEGVQLNDFQPEFKAAIPHAGSIPVKVSAGYTLKGAPLFFIDPTARRAFVNGAAFSDLKRVDPPRLGNRVVMGRVRKALLDVMKPEEVIRFLVVSQMIQTYFHISAELCALSKKEVNGGVTIFFRGSHLFFTNRRNVEKFAFSVTIARDGVITVAP